MEETALPVALYDYIYKDSERIASYYAQMFSGRLLNTERTTATREGTEKTAKGNVGVVSSDFKQSDETLENLKLVVDPHDRAVNDVLAFLVENNHIVSDASAAPHGSLILVKGSLLFVDKTIFEFTSAAFSVLTAGERSKPKHQQDQATIQAANMLQKILPKLDLPSSFLLCSDAGDQIVGTVKEMGLQEPISSYYFKHGERGLADVYLIAIKEAASPAISLSQTAFIGVAQQVAQAMSHMLFPDEAIRATPLVLFRKLL